MPDTCFVSYCRSNLESELKNFAQDENWPHMPWPYPKNKTPGYIPVFKPSKEMYEAWKSVIPARADKEFQNSDCVCAKHFQDDDFHAFKMTDENGQVKFTRTRMRLKATAVPSIWPPEIPTYLLKTRTKRKAPTERADDQSAPVRKKAKLRDFVFDALFAAVKKSPSDSEFSLMVNEKKLELPENWRLGLGVGVDGENVVWFAKTIFKPDSGPVYERTLLVRPHQPVSLVVNSRPMKTCETFTALLKCCTLEEIPNNLKTLDNEFKLCGGTRKKNCADECVGLIPIKSRAFRCAACIPQELSLRASECRRQRKDRQKKSGSSMRNKMQLLRTSNKQLKKRIKRLNSLLSCAETKIEELEKNRGFRQLTPMQKTIVEQCIQNARAKSQKGHRYNDVWMYECILMRIRGPNLYRFILQRGILPLPCMRSIQRHMRNIKAAFGFQDKTFEAMALKGKGMRPSERRGILMIDEMKLTPDTKFNIHTHQFEGFVDLGQYTPEKDKNALGDHGLVFMFRPFQGKWVQAIGCFLTKNNASGDILAKLTLEAIGLLEKAGYYVDGVVTDGASWNRRMWKKFGVKEETGACMHPLAEDEGGRKLYFFSDFPHLIKRFRAYVISAKKFKIPEGEVNLDHWKAVARHSEQDPYALTATSGKFSSAYLRRDSLAAMNVKTAFRFFGHTVKTSMQLLQKRLDLFPELEKCFGTIALIDRVNDLVDIMNSKTPMAALWYHQKGKLEKLVSFVSWLDLWDEIVEPGQQHLSHSTRHGLKVTINATLGLLSFLHEKHGFQYLMTDRLNQDPLEHFFGMLRFNGGLNNHPEASKFAQLYRLMSIYSLIKPPRGSNVKGGEILDTLLKSDDLERADPTTKKRILKRQVLKQIADIVEKGTFDPNLETTLPDIDVEVSQLDIDTAVVGYVSGYIAREGCKRWCKKCTCCQSKLVGSDPHLNFNALIDLRTYGFLVYPSKELFKVIISLETKILKNLKECGVRENTFIDILSALRDDDDFNVEKIGCNAHKTVMTQNIMYFYLTTRMYFASRIQKKLDEQARAEGKKHAKLSKVVV